MNTIFSRKDLSKDINKCIILNIAIKMGFILFILYEFNIKNNYLLIILSFKIIFF